MCFLPLLPFEAVFRDVFLRHLFRHGLLVLFSLAVFGMLPEPVTGQGRNANRPATQSSEVGGGEANMILRIFRKPSSSEALSGTSFLRRLGGMCPRIVFWLGNYAKLKRMPVHASMLEVSD